MIYFHGNAEDAGDSINFFSSITPSWKTHVISVEYPTYGIYKNAKISEKRIYKDAEDIYDFLTNENGVEPHKIIVFGR